MAVQIIPERGIGENLGSAFGTGLQQALGMLAQQKMQKMMRMQGAPGLEGLGFTPEQSKQIAQLDPSIQREVVKQKLQAPQQEQYAQALSGLLGAGQAPEGQMPQGQGLEGQMPSAEGAQQAMGPQAQQTPFGIPRGLNQQQAFQLAQLALKKQAMSERKSEAQQKLQDKRQEVIESRVKPYIEEIQKKGTAGKEDFGRLQEMEEIVKKGDITNPLIAAGLETAAKGLFGLGVDLFSLTSKDTQRFRKLSKDFAKTAKAYFGSRVTEGEIRLLLDTFPSLSQSREGQLAIIDRLKPLASAAMIYDKALEEVVEANDYKTPPNVRALVEKKVKPEVDRLAKEFKESARKRDVQHKQEMKQLYGQTPVTKLKRAVRTFVPGTEEFMKFE